MLFIIAWVLLTLAVVSCTALLARRLGPSMMIAAVAGLAVIANLLSSAKIVAFGPWAVDAGTIAYASIFLLTDMLSEFYGKEEAKKAVWAGFYSNILLLLCTSIALWWQGAPSWHGQEAFVSVFGSSWRVVLASMSAYLLSQHADIWIYSELKKLTNRRHLWLRNNLSTASSQLLDTLVFSAVAFYGRYPLLPLISGVYIAKLMIALLDTPFLYLARLVLEKDRKVSGTASPVP